MVNTNGGAAVPPDWSLTATPSSPSFPGLTAQSVAGSVAGQTIYVRPGQAYDLTESVVSGYSLRDIVCTLSDDPTPRTVTSLTLTAEESAVCVYTNDDQPATLTLVKTVTNDNGGTALPTAWTLAAAGPTPISGTTGSAPVTVGDGQRGQLHAQRERRPGGLHGRRLVVHRRHPDRLVGRRAGRRQRHLHDQQQRPGGAS